MQRRRKVALYGDSVVLAAVGASLRRSPSLEVVSLPACSRTTPGDLDALSPEVVLFDLGLVENNFAFALLRERPDLLVIGIEPGGDRPLVVSGQRARHLTTEDLVRLIERGTAGGQGEESGAG